MTLSLSFIPTIQALSLHTYTTTSSPLLLCSVDVALDDAEPALIVESLVAETLFLIY